jgi:hypothetical protein
MAKKVEVKVKDQSGNELDSFRSKVTIEVTNMKFRYSQIYSAG